MALNDAGYGIGNGFPQQVPQQTHLQQGQAQGREATELEAVIADLEQMLRAAGSHLENIKIRVLPPSPENAAKVPPQIVRTTYADKLGLLVQLASEIRDIAGQLNGRI